MQESRNSFSSSELGESTRPKQTKHLVDPELAKTQLISSDTVWFGLKSPF